MSLVSDDVHKESWFEDSLSVFVFGASGDLAKKKTYPALLQLYLDGCLPIGTGSFAFVSV